MRTRAIGFGLVVVFLAAGVNHQPGSAAPGDHTRFLFAEGTTRPGFDEFLTIANPGAGPAAVTVAFLLAGTPASTAAYTVGGQQRLTIRAREVVGAGKDLGLDVTSDVEVLAERIVYFAYGPAAWDGASATAGAEAPRTAWAFAEGTTRAGFETYLTIANPSGGISNGTATFLLDGGATITRPVSVPPRSRTTLTIHAALAANLDFGISLDVDIPVVAERVSYFNYHDRIDGGFSVLGGVPGTRFLFGEGTTRTGFDPYLLLANPGSGAAHVTVRYLPATGAPTQEIVTVPGSARRTINVRDRVAAGTDLGFDVASTTPIIAERAVYALFQGNRDGGYGTVGASDGAMSWGFAEGTTRVGFDQFLTLANPGGAASTTRIQFLPSGGATPPSGKTIHDVVIPAGGRSTLVLADVLGRPVDVGARIDSDVPIVAERTSFQNYGGLLGAHGALGTPNLKTASPGPLPSPSPPAPVPLVVDQIQGNLGGVVWSVVFAPDGGYFYSIRDNGKIFQVKPGQPPDELIDLPSCSCGEGGLMGLAVDPGFAANKRIYAMYTYSGAINNTTIANRVVRLSVGDTSAAVEGTVIDGIFGGTTHDGGRLAFGPDGFLYATAGDGRYTPNPAQDINATAGKILRLNTAGGAAPGNPFGNEVWSYGHRNPQGIAWRSDGLMYSLEHGPTCRDELNLIERGGNYGWNNDGGCPPTNVPPETINPLKLYYETFTIAPAGANFYTSSVIPQWTGSLFFTTLKGQSLFRVTLAGDGRSVVSDERLFEGEYGRIRSVIEAPDGSLWFSTDGGEIWRVRPA